MLTIEKLFLILKGNIKLLNNINLRLENGKIYGLLGPNGAGKTLFFKSILNLTDYQGRILLNGEKISSSKVGSLIEYPTFYANLTVYENLKLHASYMHLKEINIENILLQVDLLDVKNMKFFQLSLGMKQRLGIARAYLNNPELLLLDEPTNGLDPIGIKDIRILLKDELIRPAKCIMISSHNLNEIEAITDELIFINNGRIITQIKNNHDNKFCVIHSPASEATNYYKNIKEFVSVKLKNNLSWIFTGSVNELLDKYQDKLINSKIKEMTLESLYERLIIDTKAEVNNYDDLN